jgi:maleylpyruvate isomerase
MNEPTDLTLYGFWRSTATWRVRIALALKGVTYTYNPIHLRRGGGEQHRDEYRAKNPMRQVPLVEIERGGKTIRVAQSVAILELLDDLWPDPRLLPADAFLRARARQIAEMINSGIQPLQNVSVQRYLKHEMHVDEEAWTRHWVSRGLAAVEEVTAEGAGRFAVGDELSVADLFIVPELAFARRFAMPLDEYPTLLRVETSCSALPAFQQAHADEQPDAEK